MAILPHWKLFYKTTLSLALPVVSLLAVARGNPVPQAVSITKPSFATATVTGSSNLGHIGASSAPVPVNVTGTVRSSSAPASIAGSSSFLGSSIDSVFPTASASGTLVFCGGSSAVGNISGTATSVPTSTPVASSSAIGGSYVGSTFDKWILKIIVLFSGDSHSAPIINSTVEGPVTATVVPTTFISFPSSVLGISGTPEGSCIPVASATEITGSAATGFTGSAVSGVAANATGTAITSIFGTIPAPSAILSSPVVFSSFTGNLSIAGSFALPSAVSTFTAPSAVSLFTTPTAATSFANSS